MRSTRSAGLTGDAVARCHSIHAELGVRQKALDKAFGRKAAARVHADEQPVKNGKAHRARADSVEGGQAALGFLARGAGQLAVVGLDGGLLLGFGAGLGLGGQAAEDHQVVDRGVVVVRRVGGAGQVLGVQLQQGRTAQLQRGLLQLRQRLGQFLAVQVHPDKAVRGRLRGQRVGKTQAVGGELDDLHVRGLFYGSNWPVAPAGTC